MSKIRNYITITICLLGVVMPSISLAQIIITEIAWMGDSDSASHEWIELTNNGTTTVDLVGWRLAATDGSPDIPLEGSIDSGQSLVLERTSDDSAPGTAFLIYSGALGNTGEVLTLFNENNQAVATIDASSGWPGGNNDTKETAQWNGSTWITAPSTPGSYSGPIEKEDSEPESNVAATTTPNTADPVVIIKHTPHIFEMETPKQIAAGKQFTLQPKLRRGLQNIEYGNLQINFGDGAFYNSDRRLADIEHTYAYPGTYLITYELRPDPWSTTILASDSKMVEVVQPSLRLEIREQQLVLTQKDSDFLLDISGWTIQINETKYLVPPLSFLGENQFVFDNNQERGVIQTAFLYDQNGRLHAKYYSEAIPTIEKEQSDQSEGVGATIPGTPLIVAKRQIKPTIITADLATATTAETVTLLNQDLLAQANPLQPQQNLESAKFPWWNLLLPALILAGLGLLGYLYWTQPSENQPRLFE